jgi:3-dehydroquinate synthase
VFEKMVIQSHKGPYSVAFYETLPAALALLDDANYHCLIDSNVARLYAAVLAPILDSPRTIVIDAVEENKSIERVIPVIEKLVANNARRDQVLLAIGGGIIQDITCFIASTLLRGMRWRFMPTTLLAQADSCIGSKSSINLGATKNILGTFNPPESIAVCGSFLDTLDQKEIHSGIGEILKVHAIDGAQSFDNLASDFDLLFTDRAVLMQYIRKALQIKQRFIEQDEFDRGIRNIFNYGHSFGHAIESATHYAIPHGIAVTIGMDMANFIAARRGMLPLDQASRMHAVLRKNYATYAGTEISVTALLAAILKDKKNTSTMLGLIFPLGTDAAIQRVHVAPDDRFRVDCIAFFEEMANEHHG